MRQAARVLVAVAIGLIVTVALIFAFGTYTWSAIHSGWSQQAIDTYYLAAYLVPTAAGAVSAVAAYCLIRTIEWIR